mmetsp:Transcript_2634/g.2751  ORF Transcript_2634/g.2751 Transcript_2634/m.2751 type:complete len:107 (+) Transcript_2634:98-418(+)
MSARDNSASLMSARNETLPQTNTQRSARNMSARSTDNTTTRTNNLTDTQRAADAMESSRTSMSTARVHTSLAALAATKLNLLNKLAIIDSELEVKKIKTNKSYTKK